MNEDILITTEAIMPSISDNETQIILQRHCNYDRKTGDLLEESMQEQSSIINEFLENMSLNDLGNTYFLFLASNTINAHSEKKRCVDSLHMIMDNTKECLKKHQISETHILNLDDNLYYKSTIKQVSHFAEPQMFTDQTGYLDFLLFKNKAMNFQLWKDFENDFYKTKREELNAEGPDEIVKRGLFYLRVLQRFSLYFHRKKPNSRLIIWCGTHYDLISPLAKQTIFHYEKSDYIGVQYCGGISFKIDPFGGMKVNVNGNYYPFDLEDTLQHHRHL